MSILPMNCLPVLPDDLPCLSCPYPHCPCPSLVGLASGCPYLDVYWQCGPARKVWTWTISPRLTHPLLARTLIGGGRDLDPPGIGHPLAQCPQLLAVYVRYRRVALHKLRGPRGPLVRGGCGAWDVHPKRPPPQLGGALAICPGPLVGAEEDAGPGGGRRAAHSGRTGGVV